MFSLGQQRKENDPKEEDSSLMSSRMALNDHKAGMQNLDREKINQIIYEASKGSKFFENEKKKDEQVNQRIVEQQKKIATITEYELAAAEKQADIILQNLEQMRNLKRTIVHIDMDAFYAAVETRDNPSLQNKPMAVGSNSMLSTSNYVARRFGVRAAMPGFIAKKLCPQLVIIPPDFTKYTSVSREVRSILKKYDENFCPMSLDEAYLDLTNHLQIRKQLPEENRTVICRSCENLDTTYCLCDPNLSRRVETFELCHEIHSDAKSSSPSFVSGGDKSSCMEDGDEDSEQKTTELVSDKDSLEKKTENNICVSCKRPLPGYKSVTFGVSAEDAVQEMRYRIEQRTQLTASAGIAPNTLIAKICSDQNKPNGQFSVPYSREAIKEFMRDLPIRKVCGIGKVTEKMLRALDIINCSHLYKQRGLLHILYSESSFEHFMRVSLGIGSTRVERDSDRKSLSTEQTFMELSKPSELYEKCLQLSLALVTDLHKEGLMGRTISVKLKTVDFDVKTRSQTLLQHTDDKEMIYQVASDLIKTEITACSPKPFRLRLMGVRISNLLLKIQCQKQDTIDCFIKRNVSVPTTVSSQSEKNQTISTELAGSSQPESKQFAKSPAGHYCPICNRKCPTNLRLFNAHIDKCLLSGENSRPSRKRLSLSIDKDVFSERNTQSSTPLKTGKQQRRRPLKKTVILDAVILPESSVERNAKEEQEKNLTAVDIVGTSSTEDGHAQEFGISSPIFAQSSEFKLPIPEAKEFGEFACTELRQKTSLEIGVDSAEKSVPIPCNVSDSCVITDHQSISSNVYQPTSVMNSSLSLNSSENPSVSVESLSHIDLKNKKSIKNCIAEEHYSQQIEESGKVSKSETDSSLPLKNLEKISDTNLSEQPADSRINENSSKQKSPILQPLRVSESPRKLSPRDKVLSVPAPSLKEQNKKIWLQILQKCAKKSTEYSEDSVTFLERESTIQMEKTKRKSDSISPSKKKYSSNSMSADKEKSKIARNLLQYFHPTVTKQCDQTFEKDSDPVQHTGMIGIKTETLSPENPQKTFHIPRILTPPLCPTKEENPPPPLLTDSSHSNCDESENSSNKIHFFQCDMISKDELKCYPPAIDTSSEKNQTQLNHCDRSSTQINVFSEIGEVGYQKTILKQKEKVSLSSEFGDSQMMAKCEHSQVTTLSSPPLSHDELAVNSNDEKSQLHSVTDDNNDKFTATSVHISPCSVEAVEEEESSPSQEDFSKPFQAPNCEMADKESICLSEKELDPSLQNTLQPVNSFDCILNQEDTSISGDIFTCPVCSKEVTASDMAVFNEHVDLCLNQNVIHKILIEQGAEIRKTEATKRRADLSSSLLKTNKKKKYKIGAKSSKDEKMLTLDSFFS